MARSPSKQRVTLELPLCLNLLCFIARNKNAADVQECMQYFGVSNSDTRRHLALLVEGNFVRRTHTKRGHGGWMWKYTITKDGINEIIRVRSLMDYSLRVRNVTVQGDPNFVFNN